VPACLPVRLGRAARSATVQCPTAGDGMIQLGRECVPASATFDLALMTFL
jgi:hypothetical protein